VSRHYDRTAQRDRPQAAASNGPLSLMVDSSISWLKESSARRAAGEHAYSRAGVYLVAAAFEQRGMLGLIDKRRGRRGPAQADP
jgi:hypothetical protein